MARQPMPEEDDVSDSQVPAGKRRPTATRRRVLSALGASGVAAVAGCSSDSEDGGSGSSDGRVDESFTLCAVFNPMQLQFNDFNPTNNGTTLQENFGQILYDRFLLYVPGDDEFITESFILDDWTYEGDSITVQVSSDHQWHNGDDVTAQDVATHWKLDRYQYVAAGEEHPYISGVTENDDGSVTLDLHSEYNEKLLLSALFTAQDTRLVRKHSRYGEWLEQFEQTDDQSEMESILGDLQQQSFDEPLGNGPFQLAARNDTSLELELFEGHPSSEDINFTGWEWQAFQDGQGELLAIENGDIDGNVNLSPQEESVMSDWPAGTDTPRYDIPSYGGRALWFNNSKEPFDDYRVRQAIAILLDRQTIADNLPSSHTLDEVITGASGSSEDTYFGDVKGDFNTYETDEERAMQLFEEAGVNPDELSITIKTPPYQDSFVPLAQTAASQLREHGIQAETLTEEPATYYSNVANNNYELGVNVWGGDGLPNPFFTFWNLYQGTTADELQLSQTVELPPVGEPDGSTSEVNLVDVLGTLQQASSDEEMSESIRQLGWALNHHLPVIPISEGAVSTWIFHPSDWSLNPDNENLLTTYHPLLTGPRLGFLEAQE